MDPSRRRATPPAVNSGSLSKQKTPVVNDSSGTKDAMVSSYFVLMAFPACCYLIL